MMTCWPPYPRWPEPPWPSLCIVDVETTGLDPATASLIEVCFLRVCPDAHACRDRLDAIHRTAPDLLRWTINDRTFGVDLRLPLPSPLQDHTDPDLWTRDWFQARVRDGTWDANADLDTLCRVLPLLLDGVVVAGQNIPFDLSFLRTAWRSRSTQPFPGARRTLDLMSLAREHLPWGTSCSLASIASALQLTNSAPHTASGDARLTYLALCTLWQASAWTRWKIRRTITANARA